MKMVKNFKLGLVFLSLVLVVSFVLALIGAPTSPVFNDNTTTNYDKEGNFTVNWTAPAAGDAANYSIYIYADGTFYSKTTNDSALGYTFSNSTDANYTFHVAAVNVTDGVEGDNSTNISIVVDTTNPTLVYTTGTAVNNANLSQSYIFVNTTASDTNNASLVFVLYNSTVEVNTTTYDNYETQTINWTSLPEGDYTYNVTANDSATNTNSTTTYTVTLDTTNPVALASCSPSSGAAGTITCTCNGTDTDGSGVASTTASSTPSTTGTYTCSVTDYAGNSHTNTASYTVTSTTGGSTYYPILRPTAAKLAEGYRISLSKNYMVNFESSGESHVLTVGDVSAGSVKITISSDTVTFEINSGETKKVDLDSDGYYDLEILLEKIVVSKAYFVLTSINEKVADESSVVDDSAGVAEEGAEDAAATEEGGNVFLIVLAVVLIVILVIVGVVLWKREERLG